MIMTLLLPLPDAESFASFSSFSEIDWGLVLDELPSVASVVERALFEFDAD